MFFAGKSIPILLERQSKCTFNQLVRWKSRSVPAQLVMLAGAGTTWKIVEPQKRALGEALICPQWIDPLSENESLGSYVKRWASQIQPMLDSNIPVFLGGMSLGGFLAREMAQYLQPRAILLVSSCRSRHAMRRVIRRLAWMESRLPRSMHGRLVPPATRIVAWREGFNSHQRALLRDSMLEGNTLARQWSERTVLHLGDDGSQRSISEPVYLVIGDRDPFIPLDAVEPDEVVQGGRHLITLTHPDRVNDFLINCMRRHCDLESHLDATSRKLVKSRSGEGRSD